MIDESEIGATPMPGDPAGPHDGPFRPIVTYDPDGDSIEIVLERDNYHGKWIDRNLTLYLAQDGNRIVGAMVEDVTELIEATVRTRRLERAGTGPEVE